MMKNTKLTELIKDQFVPEIRSRGESYYLNGLVEFIEVNNSHATFEVEGKDVYHVRLSLSVNGSIVMRCTCPFFKSGENCKHIWASALKADSLALYSRMQHLPTLDKTKSGTIPWQEHLQSVQRKFQVRYEHRNDQNLLMAKAGAPKVGSYSIDLQASLEKGQIFLNLYSQDRLKSGDLGVLKSAELSHAKIQLYENPREREFLWDLLGRTETISSLTSYSQINNRVSALYLAMGHSDAILKKISEAGLLCRNKKKLTRYYGAYDKPEIIPYSYNPQVWSFHLQLTPTEQGYFLSGYLRNSENLVQELVNVEGTIDHFVFFEDALCRSDLSAHVIWFELIKAKPLFIGESELESFLEYYWSHVGTPPPPIDLPHEISLTEVQGTQPKIHLTFSMEKNQGVFSGKLSFDYNGKIVDFNSGEFVYLLGTREKIIRDLELEQKALDQLLTLEPEVSEDPTVQGYFSESLFLKVAEKAIDWGWEVFARDQKIQIGQNFHLDVTSGVDWFDIEANFQFGSESLRLPQLLSTLRSGQRIVPLGNGSVGILPEQWLQRFTPVLGVAKATDSGLRLNRIQALFFSAMQTDNSALSDNRKFQNLRDIIKDLQTLTPAKVDKKLKGQLRGYQKKGLAWLQLIAQHQLGGILADDMGLGKTIQVLALLSRQSSESKLPSLVLAPKSLIYNWKSETEKFAPHLKVLPYAGSSRHTMLEKLNQHDLVVTTYQTLRNDIEFIQKIPFQYLILDEAHFLKNSQSQITMATKLINAERKVALTGTPVENSLMDLFSIMSVVNPGLVTESQAQRWSKEVEPAKIQTLAKALSPFILRRTKEQVLKDLPEKSEQILYCELSAQERTKYDELKSYYWSQLSGKIESKGLAKSKIEVLEALLRLRQAACHQGLLDQNRTLARSSKFDLVLENLETLIKDGHKVLIFSQFTSLLNLFSKELNSLKIKYEYLDGQTNDRAERVAHFQNDPYCQVFLLSLKAGGVGLNLTAADYVFILDPWWNPASEAQAIDRAHRIGQSKKVFAYKVIAKDTVEEKILALQDKKKKLAKAVVSDESNVLKNLQMEDLKTLFT